MEIKRPFSQYCGISRRLVESSERIVPVQSADLICRQRNIWTGIGKGYSCMAPASKDRRLSMITADIAETFEDRAWRNQAVRLNRRIGSISPTGKNAIATTCFTSHRTELLPPYRVAYTPSANSTALHERINCDDQGTTKASRKPRKPRN
jgi:hypothetical protein